MSRLYDLIKDDIDKLNEYRKLELEDFKKAKSFPMLYEIEPHRYKVNILLEKISTTIRKKVGEKEFKDITDKYENARKDILINYVKYSYDLKLNPILDYETLFDHIEKSIPEEVTSEIIKEYEANHDYIKPVKKPLEPYVNDILRDMEEIKGITPDEKKMFTKYLNYAKDEIVEKQNNNMDHLIDMVSYKRSSIALDNLEKWANQNGMDGVNVGAYDSKHQKIVVVSNTSDKENKLFKPTLDTKPNFSKEFKNKIIALNKFLENKPVLAHAQAGETGFKEYGFLEYFNATSRLNALIDKQHTLTNDADKRANLFSISAEARKLQDISKEYNEILDYIKENFDINDVALSGNIYSGRQTSFTDSLSKFKSTLPERWDNENAPYGVILNGYIQFKALVKNADSTVEDFLADPIGEYIAGAKKNLDRVALENSLKVNEAPLGKRIATTLFNSGIVYRSTINYMSGVRGVEFLINQCEENDANYDFINASQIAITYAKKFNASGTDLFGYKSNPDLDSLKNLFAFGNDIDNLYSVSKNYPFDLDNKGIIAKAYDAQIKSKANLNPVMECRNILEATKDFFNEYKRLMLENSNNSIDINPGAILLAGKEYFKDYLLKNNINPLNIANKNERKEVLDFLNDPFVSFENKFARNNDFFCKNGERGILNFGVIERSFKECLYNKYENNIEYFTNKIAENVLNTPNANKNVNQILNDNKGGYFERKIGTTSKEYLALENSIKNSLDAYSTSYGDFTMPKYYAEKYLEHKLPEGANENNLKENEKRRVEFCRSIIKTCNELERHNKTLDENKKIEEKHNKEIKEAETLERYKARYKNIKEQQKIDKEYAYSDNTKFIEKNNDNAKAEFDFNEQLKKDSNDSILNENFDIPEESEIGNLEINK